ncbi:MAG: hypothetical protein J6V80_05505 [Clostridia bacterium]|nr:hypothetical protein [Clostridia bacterium]
MFKISPIQEKTRQNEICHIFGAEFRPDAFAYLMYDADTNDLMGMSQFEISEFGYIYDIREYGDRNDFEAMFILTRATMNFIDLCGIHTCKASIHSAPETLLKSAGFKAINGEYFCDMTGMFDGNCGGHK